MGDNSQQTHTDKDENRNRGGGRSVLLIACFFLLGLGLAALWFNRSALPGAGKRVVLSEATKTVLANLAEPVELRFYSVLDEPNLPRSVPALAAHVERLLTAYENAAPDKIRVQRFEANSDATADSAAAQGLKGFNREKGSVCYLGIAVVQESKKETLPQLLPEWQGALESDLTRAIARVAEARPSTVTGVSAQVDPATKEQVKRTIPNLESVSLEDGTRLVRESALKEFQTAAREFQTQIEQAEQKLKEAQANSSAVEQQAAMQHLQQLQENQSQKLKEIAARSQAQIQALQQLKGAPQ